MKVLWAAAVTLAVVLVAGCGQSDVIDTSMTTEPVAVTTTAPVVTTTVQPTTTTTVPVTTTSPLAGSYTEVELPTGIVVRSYADEASVAAYRGSEFLFSLTHSCGDCFASSKELTREPNGVLTDEGWKGGVWTVGPYGQLEINRLWPPDTPLNMDVLWLTDYTGATRDTLTGFTPQPGDVFTLYDELVLEPRRQNQGNFGLHANCMVGGDEIAVALISFEGANPLPLMGWTIDYEEMKFVPVEDLSALTIGSCLTAEPRPAP